MPRIIYLHGFASGPQSSKARFFRSKLEAAGAEVLVPQLDAGDFQNLTITGQLAVIQQAVDGRPAMLMGSSLGGYLAALYAARHPEIERLVLLAPAFDFPARLRARYKPKDLDRWKREGAVSVFHYADNQTRMLGYGLLEDAERYESHPDFRQPALILHGSKDPVVPATLSQDFVASHPNVHLRLFADSGHELTDVLEPMWDLARPFLLE